MLALILALPTPVAGQVPLPSIQKGKGEACLEDSATMRRYHMDYLMAHRGFPFPGLRATKYNLVQCLECHAAEQATTAGRDHFCVVCHRYAGVKIDCFECHAATASKNDRTGLPAKTPTTQ